MVRKAHTIPAFYVCYLLKSLSNPRATYIGSTRNPPRRIRQHNGEITQGAWKTVRNRPWVMTTLVHGFPSRVAALQFEWAWKNPHKSRHLQVRGDDRKAVLPSYAMSRRFDARVSVARSMLASGPYNLWPLHVTLFTQEAVAAWTAADVSLQAQDALPLPIGLTTSIELEGVDGTARAAPGARTGPLDVTDAAFTAAHCTKMARLLASQTPLKCSVCRGEIAHDADALAIALCPAHACTSVAHFACLARAFLAARPPAVDALLLPRGGTCGDCGTYVLWGDVVRGCFRRRAQGAVTILEDEEAEDVARAKKPARGRPRGRPRKSVSAPPLAVSSVPSVEDAAQDGERVDLHANDSCSEGAVEPAAPRKRGRPRLSEANKGRAKRTGKSKEGAGARGVHSSAGSAIHTRIAGPVSQPVPAPAVQG